VFFLVVYAEWRYYEQLAVFQPDLSLLSGALAWTIVLAYLIFPAATLLSRHIDCLDLSKAFAMSTAIIGTAAVSTVLLFIVLDIIGNEESVDIEFMVRVGLLLFSMGCVCLLPFVQAWLRVVKKGSL
jgi:hypothetical protein